MDIYRILGLLGLMAGLGAFGGLVQCAIGGEFHLPHVDKGANTWRPGWVGNILVGGVAAVVFWGFYGPLAGIDLLGTSKVDLHITFGQVIYSVVVGMSGGRILSLEAQKAAERTAKTNLLEVLEGISKEREEK